jgi:hypothetical protein
MIPAKPNFSFRLSDAGRATSKRPKQHNDCTVRALSTACSISYDEAYELLAKAGRKCGRGFHFRAFALAAEVAGYKFRWVPFPAKKGHPRMRPGSFTQEFPDGRFILRTAKHVMACVDGTIFDSFQPNDNRCVYGAWQLVNVGENT